MYLSYDALYRVAQKLGQIAPDDGKKRKERVSGLRYFLACAELLQKDAKPQVSLAVGQQGRTEFIKAVGHVVATDANGGFTPDFYQADQKAGYNVSSNFLTTVFEKSRYQKKELPGRPSPLIVADKEIARLHPDHKDNLEKDYALKEIKDALALWLVREIPLPPNLPDVDIVAQVNRELEARYGNIVASLIKITITAYKEILNGVNPVLVPEKPDLSTLFATISDSNSDSKNTEISEVARVGRNIIFYGAPGTGKSYRVDGLAGNINVTRTVFHPDTQNSDFFGCLKPGMDGTTVKYAFSPGPFCKALRASLLDKENHHFLIIEEINRAPAAAVFGELFQLLDRRDDVDGAGNSSYEVDFPNEESRKWMSSDGGPVIEKLYLPSNLTLLATMNSSDQGVYPLDTAFRRRWEQEYVPLYAKKGPKGNLNLVGKSDELWSVPWRSFVKCLNDWLLKKYNVAEDRLLGLWFVKNGELGESIPAKILLYLWDDLLRHEDRGHLFSRTISTYGEIDIKSEKGEPIFDERFLNYLEESADITVSGKWVEPNENLNAE